VKRKMEKTGWVIIVVAALLVFGVSQTSTEEKQFKKTGADDVMFRTSDAGYGSGNIAFSTVCDGSDLEVHTWITSVRLNFPSCADMGDVLFISDLPGTSISVDSCASSIELYREAAGAGDYVVCCDIGSLVSVAIYDEAVSGSQSAVSSSPANELMCEAEQVCSTSFNDFVSTANSWVSCT